MTDRFEGNPYYYPDTCGLEKVLEFELEEASWSFNTVCIWKHVESGKLYWAHDSGCSCPSPFEDFNSLSDLTEITSVKAFKEAVQALREHGQEYYAANLRDACEIIKKAKKR